jgi:hypothetical protein
MSNQFEPINMDYLLKIPDSRIEVISANLEINQIFRGRVHSNQQEKAHKPLYLECGI